MLSHWLWNCQSRLIHESHCSQIFSPLTNVGQRASSFVRLNFPPCLVASLSRTSNPTLCRVFSYFFPGSTQRLSRMGVDVNCAVAAARVYSYPRSRLRRFLRKFRLPFLHHPQLRLLLQRPRDSIVDLVTVPTAIASSGSTSVRLLGRTTSADPYCIINF